MISSLIKKHFTSYKGGFTLGELLVVVLIIGVLASIALPIYNRAVLKSRFVQLQILAGNYAKAASQYYIRHGSGPNYWAGLRVDVPGCAASDSEERGYMHCSKVSCDLYGGEDENIVCFLKIGTPQVVAYAQWFRPGENHRECWTMPDNRDGQAVCKGLGGQKFGSSNHGSCSGCDIYLLP